MHAIFDMLKVAGRRPAMKRTHSSGYEEENQDISVAVCRLILSEQVVQRSKRGESLFSKV